MPPRVIRIVVFGAIAIGVATYVRSSRKNEAGGTAKAEATAILMRVEGYEANKRFYEMYTDPAHQAAMNQAYTVGGRRTRDTFDEGEYMSVFFDKLTTMARDQGKPDIVKSLIRLCDDEGIVPLAKS